MSGHRLLKYTNVALTVIAVAALAAVWWLAWRPLPQTSGTVQAPVRSKATVTRDVNGTPHIEAANDDDLFFAQGYVTAQDRLFQLDGLRRSAAGELAEIVGPAGIASDREARALRLRRAAEVHYLGLDARERSAFAAYARGVNHFIETHRGNLPLEFRLLRYQPRPWSVVDSILSGLQMWRTLTMSYRADLRTGALLRSGADPAKVAYLWPVRTGGEVQLGSNAWAVSGASTASGKPLLAGDMHLEHSFPGVWYMTRLRAPGWNVAGFALPGVPGIIVGHNERIAWSVTNLGYDVQDLYVEKFEDRTGRFEFRGQILHARRERDIIKVRGAQDVTVDAWVTVHGPIVLASGGDRMALRWVAAEPGAFATGMGELNRARNWDEFRAALAGFSGPALNYVYADVDGNIGLQVAGRLPLRQYESDRPLPGPGGDHEWAGYIPFDDLPRVYNPASGRVVTANQNPFPRQYPHRVHGAFAPYYRSRQIDDRLRAGKKLRPEDMMRLQTDVYSGFSHFLAREIVAAFDRRKATNPEIVDAVRILREWDGQMAADRAAPLIATYAWQSLSRAIAATVSPQLTALEGAMSAAVVEKLLRERPKGWFPDYDLLLLRALADGVDQGRREQNTDVSRWSYGAYNALTISHPIGSRLPLVGKYFTAGPVAMSGSPTTVKQMTRRLGPSMRFVADLSDWDKSLMQTPLGQSGQILSGHFKDQWDEYLSGQGIAMPFNRAVTGKTLVLQP